MKNNIIKSARKADKYLLDLLFPKICQSCGKKGVFLCNECLYQIEIKKIQTCPVCQKSATERGKVCRLCNRLTHNFPLHSLLISSDYQDALIKKLIHQYKYKFAFELADPLSEILIKAIKKHELIIPDLIIPVPLHPFRLRWRGFNQSALLAEKIGEHLLTNLDIPIDSQILQRVKNTPSQANIKKAAQRRENIKNAFRVNTNKENLAKIKNKRVLLVDDVCSSGSTLFECASQIQPLQPKSISAIVIARQR
ncbi:MAG: ComF family protein [Candidatus Moraniibacteriota bacterium]